MVVVDSLASSSSASIKPPEAGKLKESDLFGKLMSQPTPVATKSKAINQLRKSADGKPANLNDDSPVPVMERKTGTIHNNCYYNFNLKKKKNYCNISLFQVKIGRNLDF